MLQPDSRILQELIDSEMPFGKYKGWKFYRLPVNYLEWFERQGFPPGKLGMLLSTIHIIKTNGLESLLDPLLKK
jgi:uncharacterized protein (DUF3820 family)